MNARPLAAAVAHRLQLASDKLKVANPMDYVGGLIQRTFPLPEGDPRYAANTLTPGAAPLEPSFSEQEPNALRFTIEPLGPEASALSRRDEATREMRRLIGPLYGRNALRWFDQRSEEWRGQGRGRLHYGAFFGTSYNSDGLNSSKIYYEMSPGQIDALPVELAGLVRLALETVPALFPLFTSITCREESGNQRTTFLHRGPLRLADLSPLLQRLGLAHQLPALMQIFGVALGGRFELPEQSVLIGLAQTDEGPELEVYVLLGMLPDLPPTFLDLLTLGLAERPREIRALGRWLRAMTPETQNWPGNFSILSVRTTPRSAPRVSLYLRPVEFEIQRRLEDIPAINRIEAVEPEPALANA
jgi:hypothetical protein